MNALAYTPERVRSPSGLRIDVAVLFIAGALLSLASGYRWFGEGRDYSNYADFYAGLGPFTYFRDERFEPLFVTSAWLSKYVFFVEFQIFISGLVALSLWIKLRLIYKNTEWPFLACITYLMTFYFLHEYTQIRQALAIAFGLLSIQSYLRRDFIGSLIYIGIGIMFQSSVAVLGIGVAVFNLVAMGWIGALIGLVAVAKLVSINYGGLASFAIDYIPYLTAYIDDVIDSQPLNIVSGPNIGFFVMLMIATPAVKIVDRRRVMYLIMCLLAVVSFLAFRDFPVLAQRFRDLFGVFGILLAFSFPARTYGGLAGTVIFISGAWSLYRLTDLLQ